MTTPVASTPASPPPPAAGAATTGTTSPPAGTTPFQTLLSAASSAQAGPTDGAAATANEQADGSNVSLLALLTQTFGPAANAAVARALGESNAPEPTTAGTTAEERARADEIALDRGNGPASAQAATQAAAALLAPPATLPPVTPAPAAPAGPTPASAQANAVTAGAIVANASNPGGERLAPLIPAQAPIVPGLVPAIPPFTELNAVAPPVAGPTAPLPVTDLPAAQLGDRPATAGERFVAAAAAGLRIAAPPPPPVAFSSVLVQETSAPMAAPAAPPGSVAVSATASVTTLTAGAVAAPVAVSVTPPPAPPAAAPVPQNIPALATADLSNVSGVSAAFVPNAAGAVWAAGRPTFEVAAGGADPGRSTEAAAAGAVVTPAPAPQSASVPAPAAPNATPPAAPAQQVADAVVSHAHLAARPGGVEFQMRLDPPDLGPIQVRLVARGDEVHGQVIVASEAVRGLIESQLPELRQRLEAAGVPVQGFNVSADAGGGGGRNPPAGGPPPGADAPPLAPARAALRFRAAAAPLGSLDVTA
jgi:hypothetical protein